MLTTIENIRDVRDISANLKEARIAPYIKEVEDAYIMPSIGADLYEKLDNGTTTDDVLLNGGYYTNGAGVRDYCHGLRLATAYYAYARVLMNNQINVTAFGVTQKSSSFSTPTSSDGIDAAANSAKKMGDLYIESCVRYLHKDEECVQRLSNGSKLHIQVLV